MQNVISRRQSPDLRGRGGELHVFTSPAGNTNCWMLMSPLPVEGQMKAFNRADSSILNSTDRTQNVTFRRGPSPSVTALSKVDTHYSHVAASELTVFHLTTPHTRISTRHPDEGYERGHTADEFNASLTDSL